MTASILSDAEKRELVRAFKRGDDDAHDLSWRYGVSLSVVYRIIALARRPKRPTHE